MSERVALGGPGRGTRMAVMVRAHTSPTACPPWGDDGKKKAGDSQPRTAKAQGRKKKKAGSHLKPKRGRPAATAASGPHREVRNSISNVAERRVKLPKLSRELVDVLVTEWLQVTQSPRHWVPLPRVPSCADVLAKFAMTKASTPGAVAWAELAAGLRAYFDATLPKLLLYRQEREQYDKFARGRGAPSTLYGAEHLLRLLSRLPHLLGLTDLHPEELKRLQAKLPELYKFLVRGRSKIFLSTYELREALLSTRRPRGLPPQVALRNLASPPGSNPPT
mmetsp:Transcript_26687/g.80563  ORF Transcript_26687/g.80563 Transcript_26687/m.80563 type:complete len:278 (+) Transcript_26687:345-1178(+)